MSTDTHHHRVRARFSAAADSYDRHAGVQRQAALALAERIARLPLPSAPRILEIGCGTGLLTRAVSERLPDAIWTVTDISPAMLARARATSHLPDTARFQVMNGEFPDLAQDKSFDLICSSLAVQWFDDLDAGLARLAALLAPGGHLAISTLARHTFREWRAVHEALGVPDATPVYPPAQDIGASLPLAGKVEHEEIMVAHHNGLDFLRSLKGIGATTPRRGSRSLSAAQLRQVLHHFDEANTHVTYDIGYGTWSRAAARRGVFVTGTDTGVGKTLVSALLAKAWHADYWKPMQTGVADEAGDTPTVAELAQLGPERVHAPACILQAPLSPWAAAALEAVTLDPGTLALPDTSAALVVEGAGGLLVPVDEHTMMLDIIARLGLPVVLVARSGLGTINHTLLSLQALRAARIPVCGVVMNGPPNPGNRMAIERFGKTQVLFEVPWLDQPDAVGIGQLAARVPELALLLEQVQARQAGDLE